MAETGTGDEILHHGPGVWHCKEVVEVMRVKKNKQVFS